MIYFINIQIPKQESTIRNVSKRYGSRATCTCNGISLFVCWEENIWCFCRHRHFLLLWPFLFSGFLVYLPIVWFVIPFQQILTIQKDNSLVKSEYFTVRNRNHYEERNFRLSGLPFILRYVYDWFSFYYIVSM